MNKNRMSDGMLAFIDNLKNKNMMKEACHNIYEIQTVDMDGNITGTAYGINVITNAYMTMLGNNVNTGSSSTIMANTYLVVGTGTGTPTISDTTLFSLFGTGILSKSDSDVVHCPLEYNSITGIISGSIGLNQSYIDYNVTGVTANTNITELGLCDGSTIYNLYSHALIYDVNGNVSSIVKKPNERMYIRPYIRCSMNKNIITDAWDNGLYILINPLYEIFKTNVKMYIEYASVKDITGNGEYWNITRKSIANGTYMDLQDIRSDADTVLEDQTKCIAFLSNSISSDNRRIFRKLKLTTPETVTLNGLYTNNCYDGNFDERFGHISDTSYDRCKYPITDFNMISLKTFNIDTLDYDIDVNFTSPTNLEYATSFRYAFVSKFTLNSVVGTYYVYANTRIETPITKFNNMGVIIYATDTYWDTSTWTPISNLNAVPAVLQSKKYYIANKSGELYPATPTHSVTVTTQPYSRFTSQSSSIFNYKILSDDQYGWVYADGRVYFEVSGGTNTTYKLITGGNTFTETTGDKLIIPLDDRSVHVYNMTNPAITPTSVELTPTIGTVKPKYSFSNYGHGFLAIQSLDSTVKNLVILDVHASVDGPALTTISDAAFGYAIKCSDKCVYQDLTVTNSLTFNIYDMTNNVITDNFTIDIDNATVVGITGWKNYIYIRLSLTSGYVCYLYNMSEENLTALPTDFTLPDLRNAYDISSYEYAVDEIMVTDNHRFGNNDYIKYILASDPTVIKTLNSSKNFGDIHNLQKVSYGSGSKLFLTLAPFGGSYKSIHDIGCLLSNQTYDMNTSTQSFDCRFVYFKNGFLDIGVLSTSTSIIWYPIEYFMEYKAVGTTKSFQCMNDPKKVTFSLDFRISNNTALWSE